VLFNAAFPNIVHQLRSYLVISILAADVADLKATLDELGVGAFNKYKFKYLVLIKPLAQQFECKELSKRNRFFFTVLIAKRHSTVYFLKDFFKISHASDASLKVRGFQLLQRYV